VKGLSPIAYARETIGLGLAAQRFGSAFFENGALPSAVIEAEGEMSQDAVDGSRRTGTPSTAASATPRRSAC
jgi:phage portal protein BeeE